MAIDDDVFFCPPTERTQPQRQLPAQIWLLAIPQSVRKRSATSCVTIRWGSAPIFASKRRIGLVLWLVRDSAKNCVCSRGLKALKPGGKASLWAKFPVPPADVETVSVVIPHFISMDDVPISK